MDEEQEPMYEVELDFRCLCHEQGIESEWNWDADQQCWVCIGCGETQ